MARTAERRHGTVSEVRVSLALARRPQQLRADTKRRAASIPDHEAKKIMKERMKLGHQVSPILVPRTVRALCDTG